jgi:hypothetical protein
MQFDIVCIARPDFGLPIRKNARVAHAMRHAVCTYGPELLHDGYPYTIGLTIICNLEEHTDFSESCQALY